MRRLPLLMVTLMVTLVAGCGGAPETFTPQGAATTAVTSSGPAQRPVTTTTTTVAATPPPALPSDFRIVYRSTGGTPAVRAFGDFWKAWWSAVATQGRDTRYRAYVAAGTAPHGTAFFTEVVDGWARDNLRPTGVITAHRFRVFRAAGDQILLVGCGDETRTGTKDLTTGAVSWSFGKQRSSRYKMRVTMARGADGGWLVAGYQSVPAADPVARECR